MRATTRIVLLLLLLTGVGPGLSGQAPDMRMVIGTNVVCRSEPDRAAPAAGSLRLGEVVWISGAQAAPDGEQWLARRERPCWVLGALTAPLSGYDNPDPPLLALAAHALNPATKATFEHLVAADNLLIRRRQRQPPFARAPERMPAMLELRHLQIVQAAALAVGDSWAIAHQPLRMAWVLAHADVVSHFEPGATYHVPTGRFWDLYGRHRDAAEAEQIAWAAATTPVYTDECYTDCVLAVATDTYARYWRLFPQGPHVADAVTMVIRRAEYAAQFCPDVSSGTLTLGGPDLGRMLADLRNSLAAVTVTGKSELLGLFAKIERECRVR